MSKFNTSIMKLITAEKSKITDEELFSSTSFRAYLQKIATATSKRYKRKITVTTTYEKNGSYTDNNIINIDTGSVVSKSFPSRSLKLDSIIGTLGHEVGHVLYTNFSELNTFSTSLRNGFFYPPIDEIEEEYAENLQEIEQLLFDKNKAAIKVIGNFANHLVNILEDVYVNTLICKNFPGSFKRGILMNRIRAYEKSLSIQSQIDKCFEEISIIINLLIIYAICGKINNLENYEGEYLDFLDECIPLIDYSVLDCDIKARFKVANEILVKAWKWIKPLLDKIDNDDQLEQLDKKLDGEVQENSQTPLGKTKGESTDELTIVDSLSDEEHEELEKSVCSTISPEITDEILENGTGSITYNDGYSGSENTVNIREFEKVLDEVATEKATLKLETELCSDLQKFSDVIRYGNAHKNVDIVINRDVIVTERMKSDYNQLLSTLLPYSKKLQQQILPVLKELKANKFIKNQISGKRIDVNSVIRDNSRYFSSKKIPNVPDMAVGILIDESGSMDGERITISKATAIILEDFCRNIEIPSIIYGHTEYNRKVHLFSYSEFESFDANDKYRLMDISAKSNNRDGAAIRYICERLLQRPEEIKLLIIISDGLPYADGYTGTAAEADIRGIKREYENKGITIFAAAIGDDKENIERIYKNGFLDIRDLNMLPKRLINLITKYINVA